MPDGNQVATTSNAIADPTTLNLHQRLLAVMGDVQYIQKDRTIGTGGNGYKVVTHDAVTAKVRPALLKHRVLDYPQNLVCTQNGNRTEITMDVKFVNADAPDDFILIPTVGYGIDAQDKGPGKAVSYAVKMALLKALNLETGEDADDNTNVDHVPAETKVPERALTKEQARPEYTQLVKEIMQQQSITDLESWGARNKARLGAMPADWQASLKNEYAEHKSILMGRAAQ